MGLFEGMDFNDPQTIGLLTAAAQMMQAGGPSRTPVGLGQALGQGVMGGLGAYQQAQQSAQQMQADKALRELKMKQLGMGLEKDQMEMQQYRDQMDRNKRIQARMTGLGAPQGGQQAQPSPMASFAPGGAMSPKVGGPDWAQAYQAQQPERSAMQPRTQKSATRTFADSLISKANIYSEEGDDATALKMYEQAMKFMPKAKDLKQVTVNGKVLYVPIFEDGTPGEPIPYEVAEKLHFSDNGQRTGIGQNPFTGAVINAGIQKQQSPESIASQLTQMRAQNMSDARQREANTIQKDAARTQVVETPEGFALVDKGTGRVRPAIAESGEQVQQKDSPKYQSAKLQGQLQEGIKLARELLPDATSSGVGSLADTTANFFGVSTTGADAASQLETLAGWMTSNVPRMQGPQSDKDTMLYRQMAAQVGDRTKPTSQRLAALNTLETLQKKYAEIAGIQPESDTTKKPPSSQQTTIAKTPPREAINMLRMNPKLRDAFDQKYGDGTAASILGR